MVHPRKLVSNTIMQIFGRGATLLISLVTLSYIANHLLVDGSALKGYGQYTIVLTYISIIGATADLGLFTFVVREITGKELAVAGRIVGNALVFRFLLMIATLVVLLVLFHFLPYAAVVKQGILLGVVIAFLMLFSQAIATIFQANLIPQRIVIAEVIGRLVIAVLTIYFLYQGLGLLPVIAANLIGNIVLLGVSYGLSRSSVPIKISFDLTLWRQALPQFWSIAVVTLLSLVHFRLDSLILSFYQPVTEVGIYGVAYRIFDIILIIPAILAANLLPVLTRLNDSGQKQAIGQLVEKAAGILFAVSFTIGVVIMLLAPWIIIFVTQKDFLNAALPLRILTPAFVVLFLTTLFAETIIAIREQKRLIVGYCLVVLLDIVLNLILIPRFSYVGAATTTLVSEIVLMGYSLYLLTRLLPVQLLHLPLGKIAFFALLTILAGLLAHGIIPSLTNFGLLNKFQQGVWLLGSGGAILLAALATFSLIFKVKLKELSSSLTE